MNRSAHDLTPVARCFALLSRAFPRPISERYGGEMLDAFVRERDLLGLTEGRWPAFRFSLSACFNVAKEGLKARGSGRRRKQVSRSESASGGGESKLPVGGVVGRPSNGLLISSVTYVSPFAD